MCIRDRWWRRGNGHDGRTNCKNFIRNKKPKKNSVNYLSPQRKKKKHLLYKLLISVIAQNYDNKKIEVGADNLKSVDSKIRSSVGFTLYWSTPIGPLQFNWAKPQQYLSGVDKTENFSFNIASQF